jgi:putative Holliday junction resolvase
VTRLVAFDPGTRRVGIAVADSELGIAFARPALKVRGIRDASSLVEVARSEGASRAIVGLARNMDGSEGPQAAAARDLGEALLGAGLEVVFVDERLTSWDAGQQLSSEGRRPVRASGELDSAAARLILQDYLDTRRNSEPRIAPDTQEGR